MYNYLRNEKHLPETVIIVVQFSTVFLHVMAVKWCSHHVFSFLGLVIGLVNAVRHVEIAPHHSWLHLHFKAFLGGAEL